VPRSASRVAPTAHEAEQLRQAINALGDYAHVNVRTERGHLNVYAGDTDPVARLTPLDARQYGLSFHTHTGRWEPMPFTGDIPHLANVMVSVLEPYLQRYDFSGRKSESGH